MAIRKRRCKKKKERRGEGGTGPHSFQRKEVFGGLGSKATPFQFMRNLLFGCRFPPRPPPALTPPLSQHLDQTQEGRWQEKMKGSIFEENTDTPKSICCWARPAGKSPSLTSPHRVGEVTFRRWSQLNTLLLWEDSSQAELLFVNTEQINSLICTICDSSHTRGFRHNKQKCWSRVPSPLVDFLSL